MVKETEHGFEYLKLAVSILWIIGKFLLWYKYA